MYFDTKACQVCGAEVRLRAHGDEPVPGKEPDGTVDERVCTNTACATHRGDERP